MLVALIILRSERHCLHSPSVPVLCDSCAIHGPHNSNLARAVLLTGCSPQGPAMFPDHLNTMVQTASHQRRASQQNLANAAAHLLMEPTAKEQPSIWSTPVSPLDLMYSTLHSSGGMEALHSSNAFDQLYSTASTSSDRCLLVPWHIYEVVVGRPVWRPSLYSV